MCVFLWEERGARSSLQSPQSPDQGHRTPFFTTRTNMIKSILLSSLLMIVTQASDSSYVLTPSGRDGEQVGVVIIQGAQCPPSGYEHLAREIQSSLNDNSMNAWIGVPEYIADVPEPLQFGSKFEEIVSKMKDKGMNETTKIVVAAHSLGAVMSQSWVHDHASDHNVVAQVLFGATVLRKYRDKSYPVPTLTVDGTLDGLLHITRQAVGLYLFSPIPPLCTNTHTHTHIHTPIRKHTFIKLRENLSQPSIALL
jgi:hypothetical protein